MKIIAHAEIKATDSIRLAHYPTFTRFTTGPTHYEADALHIVGTRFHRADWLRRLAVAATQAADELDAGEQVA